MTAYRVLTTAALAVVLLLAGCGDDIPATGGDGPTGSETPTAEPPSETFQPTDEPSGPTDDPTENPTDPGNTPQPTPSETGSMSLTGYPEAGVEAGCWLLDGYLLLGGDRELIESGRELEVTGEVTEGVMTTCQQGTPFRVDTVVGIEPR